MKLLRLAAERIDIIGVTGSVNRHSHRVEELQVDPSKGGFKFFTEADNTGHRHDLNILDDQLAQLANGQTVDLFTTSTGMDHSHPVRLTSK
ncbi:MAG TPA: hypothetical protein ENI23_05445 [bacterium]|nr:hypothetical protein [bacterium]